MRKDVCLSVELLVGHDQPCDPLRRVTQLGVSYRVQKTGDEPMKVTRHGPFPSRPT